MTAGISAAGNANKWLDWYRGVTPTAPAAVYAQLHIGDPGSVGTTSPSAVTTRSAITWSAASAGSISLSNTPTWTMTTGETISHISLWDASTSGTFLRSIQAATPKAVVAADILNLTSCTIALTPLAA